MLTIDAIDTELEEGDAIFDEPTEVKADNIVRDNS
jgi:hypothetical protein